MSAECETSARKGVGEEWETVVGDQWEGERACSHYFLALLSHFSLPPVSHSALILPLSTLSVPQELTNPLIPAIMRVCSVLPVGQST